MPTLEDYQAEAAVWYASQPEVAKARPLNNGDLFATIARLDRRLLAIYYGGAVPARVPGGAAAVSSVLRNRITAWLLERPSHQSWIGLEEAACKTVERFVMHAPDEVLAELNVKLADSPVPAGRWLAWRRHLGEHVPRPTPDF